MAKDPVCGMEVRPDQAAAETNYMGREYYFCSVECKRRFDLDPQDYLPGKGPAEADVTTSDAPTRQGYDPVY